MDGIFPVSAFSNVWVCSWRYLFNGCNRVRKPSSDASVRLLFCMANTNQVGTVWTEKQAELLFWLLGPKFLASWNQSASYNQLLFTDLQRNYSFYLTRFIWRSWLFFLYCLQTALCFLLYLSGGQVGLTNMPLWTHPELERQHDTHCLQKRE